MKRHPYTRRAGSSGTSPYAATSSATPEQVNEPGTGQHHIIDHWYGDVPTRTQIGKLLVQSLRGEPVLGGDLRALTQALDVCQDGDTEAELLASIGRAVLDAVSGSSAYIGTSWWTDLDRDGIQEAVRWLRKARDDSYGRDE